MIELVSVLVMTWGFLVMRSSTGAYSMEELDLGEPPSASGGNVDPSLGVTEDADLVTRT